MTTARELAGDFLAHGPFAVASVSRRDDLAANHICRGLRARGHRVFALSRSMSEFEGEPCFPDLSSLPHAIGGIVVATSPRATLELARECARLRIPRVWMHCMFGVRPVFRRAAAKVTSVSPEAVQLCRDAGITVIAGGCPLQFGGDAGHRAMRLVFGLLGAYSG